MRYCAVNGVYPVPKDSVKIPEDDEVRGVIIKIVTIPDVRYFCYNLSGKIKGKIAILRSIFKKIVGVNIFRKNDNKSFGYILYKDTTLEMEDDIVVCIKYKGKRVAETVDSITGYREYDGKVEDIIVKTLIFNFEENKEFKKLLKLAARESLINSEQKFQEKMEKKYPVFRLRKHIDPDTNSISENTLNENKHCAHKNVKINGNVICKLSVFLPKD